MKKQNNVWIIILVIIAVAFFMYNKAESPDETKEALKGVELTTEENLGWFAYSSADGDGSCNLNLEKEEVCTNEEITIKIRGLRDAFFSVGIGTDMKTWEVVAHVDSGSAGNANLQLKAPETPGDYLVRAVYYGDRGVEGGITNIKPLIVREC